MNRKLINIILSIFFLVISFMGFIKGDEIAHTIALLYVWFCIIVSLIIVLVSDGLIEKTFNITPSMPRSMDIMADLAIVGMLLLDKQNHWISALLFAAQIVIVHEAFKLGAKYNKEKLKEENLDFNFDK